MLLAAAAIIAPALREAHADAPRITSRRVDRHKQLTLLGGALLASAAASWLPAASSSPLPAPNGDDQHAGDPPQTPDHTTAPTDHFLSETDDDQPYHDDDQSDYDDDTAPPVAPSSPPISDEGGSNVNLEDMLPGVPGDMCGALEEDIWYGIGMFGLSDFEALRRAYTNMQAILDGDNSLYRHMEDVHTSGQSAKQTGVSFVGPVAKLAHK